MGTYGNLSIPIPISSPQIPSIPLFPSPMPAHTTWDGQPISPEKPYGVTIVVYRRTPEGMGFLVLHRAGQNEEGDWAWTPPSGARHPNEAVEACARRELFEETGLELVLNLTDCGTEDWWVYIAEAQREGEVSLSVEHDRAKWVSPMEVCRICAPDVVSLPLWKVMEQVIQFEDK